VKIGENGDKHMDRIQPGLVGEHAVEVDERMSAETLGSGRLPVFATPAMIALMEAAAVAAVDPLLDAGSGSVGIAIQVRHLAATLIGQQVRARAEVTGVEGLQITFLVQAWDEQELIGEGTHTRTVIDVERFMRRVTGKRT
jgi:fluoroacetyl-CoA thioesterase